MRFPYTVVRSPKDRPIIPVFVERGDRRLILGILDTGADLTLLPYRVALELGVMLGRSQKISTATGQRIDYRPGKVCLEIRSRSETIRWRTEVGFTAAELKVPVFGDKGFLEFFLSAFDGQLREVLLTPRPNLPRLA